MACLLCYAEALSLMLSPLPVCLSYMHFCINIQNITAQATDMEHTFYVFS